MEPVVSSIRNRSLLVFRSLAISGYATATTADHRAGIRFECEASGHTYGGIAADRGA
jgi:hypothetical protein